ncbi:ceramide-1-phosphate transfer protein [Hyalella azteca]|uniref:Ceramide-1-phosphate transfer protein n=1 Tax=Hyalella azteca TaxID=294128 RepID=A0A979FJS5_HYAAZ|nr:ceramide-1-phosphate transfer protein [Hyalella azteca]
MSSVESKEQISPQSAIEPTSPMLDNEAATALQETTTAPEHEASPLMDVDVIMQGFQECLKEEALGVDGYIRAYSEMTKFFEGLGTMFNFITNDLVSKVAVCFCYLSGQRTAEFVSGFLRQLQSVSMDTKLAPIAKPIYAETLAKHHPWLICKTVGAVMLLLPDKKVMVARLFGESEAAIEKSMKKIPGLVTVMDKVYEATQKFYSDYDMLNLP